VDLLVVDVFLVRTPNEISYRVVAGVGIWKVPALHAVRSWPDERFENDVVNVSYVCFAIASKTYRAVPRDAVNGRTQFFPWLRLPGFIVHLVAATPYASVAADPVSGKTNNISILDRRICYDDFGHDLAPFKQVVLMSHQRQLVAHRILSPFHDDRFVHGVIVGRVRWEVRGDR